MKILTFWRPILLLIAILLPTAIFSACLSPGGDGIALKPSMEIEPSVSSQVDGDGNATGVLSGNTFEVSGQGCLIGAGFLFNLLWAEMRSRKHGKDQYYLQRALRKAMEEARK